MLGEALQGGSDEEQLQKIYFVVMKNFLPAKMHMAFDLKGCTFKRRALNENQLNTSLSGKVATLRDWEWMDIAMEVQPNSQETYPPTDDWKPSIRT